MRGRRAGRGSGSSGLTLGGRSSRSDMQRLKSGNGDDVRAFMRMFITTSGLYRSGLNWYLCIRVSKGESVDLGKRASTV